MKGHPRDETEALAGLARVQRPSRLPVGLRRVPSDLAREARHLGDQLHELPDRDLLAHAEVHGVRPVVALGGENDPLGASTYSFA